MRRLTLDRSADTFFTTEKIGRTRELTPEGFLLCRDVRIARTGEMLYGPGEIASDDGTAIELGRDQIIRVSRGPEDLFRPETLASFNGKAVTNDHPDEDVNPDNWAELSAGTVQNPRQGEGPDAEFTLADLLITRADAIKLILDDEQLEVSCGYDASYEQTEPGRARQFNIIGNHVALVDKGRCGPRCAIGDAEMKTRDKKRSWADRIMTAFKARDEAALEEAIAEARDEMTEGAGGEGEHKVVIEIKGPTAAEATTDEEAEEKKDPVAETTDDEGEAPPAWFKKFADGIESRLSKLEGGATTDADPDEEKDEDAETTEDAELELGETTADEEAIAERADPAESTRDSASLATAFQDMIARAEILAPGVKLPTFDGKVTRKITRDRMCAFRRRALDKAFADEDTRQVLLPIAGRNPDVKKLTCDAVTLLFNAGSELVKNANSAITSTGYVHDHAGGAAKPATISDINQKNRDFWRSKGGAL